MSSSLVHGLGTGKVYVVTVSPHSTSGETDQLQLTKDESSRFARIVSVRQHLLPSFYALRTRKVRVVILSALSPTIRHPVRRIDFAKNESSRLKIQDSVYLPTQKPGVPASPSDLSALTLTSLPSRVKNEEGLC